MNNEKENLLEKEILSEEYVLGNEYYNKLLNKAKEENKKYE